MEGLCKFSCPFSGSPRLASQFRSAKGHPASRDKEGILGTLVAKQESRLAQATQVVSTSVSERGHLWGENGQLSGRGKEAIGATVSLGKKSACAWPEVQRAVFSLEDSFGEVISPLSLTYSGRQF